MTFLSGNSNKIINNELVKASNGFLYSHAGHDYCPGGNTSAYNNYGTIVKVNLATNTIQDVYLSKDVDIA